MTTSLSLLDRVGIPMIRDPARMDTFEFFNWLETASISALENFSRGEMPRGVNWLVRR
jgi:hypothetical protein